VGLRVFLFTPTVARLAEWRSRTQSVAAREAGFAYAAYGQLKFAQIVEPLAARLADIGGGNPRAVRHGVWRHLQGLGIDRPAQALAAEGAKSDYVMFLRNFDLDFRIRRLRFLIRRVNALTESAGDETQRRELEAMKAGLYTIIGPHLQRRQPGFFAGTLAAAAAGAADNPGAALAALAATLDLKGLDTSSDAALVALFAATRTKLLRRALLSAYLGFPFYDIAMLPLLQGDGTDEFDEIKVDRVSPDDALSLRAAGGGMLKGSQFNAFGAFFSRAYREHDYLWGRLHSAERLIDVVCSALPDGAMLPAATIAGLKRDAFAAIIAAERPHLALVPDLFAALDAALA
jgi:hypothetical protein